MSSHPRTAFDANNVIFRWCKNDGNLEHRGGGELQMSQILSVGQYQIIEYRIFNVFFFLRIFILLLLVTYVYKTTTGLSGHIFNMLLGSGCSEIWILRVPSKTLFSM